MSDRVMIMKQRRNTRDAQEFYLTRMDRLQGPMWSIMVPAGWVMTRAEAEALVPQIDTNPLYETHIVAA